MDDPGPCDVWMHAGSDSSVPGTQVYCANHSVHFLVPDNCPGGRAAIKEKEDAEAARIAKEAADEYPPIVWREFI